MLLHKILTKFNLTFFLLVGFASVTSAAVLIQAHTKKLASSGSSFGYKVSRGGSSSSDSRKAFGGSRGFHGYSRSHTPSKSNLPETLIYSYAFDDQNPFNSNAFGIKSLEFGREHSPFHPYTPPSIELPTWEDLKQKSSKITPVPFQERPELIVVESDFKPSTSEAAQPAIPNVEIQDESTPTLSDAILPALSHNFRQAEEGFIEPVQGQAISVKKAATPQSAILSEGPQLQTAHLTQVKKSPSPTPPDFKIDKPASRKKEKLSKTRALELMPSPEVDMDPLVARVRNALASLLEVADMIVPSTQDQFILNSVDPIFRLKFKAVMKEVLQSTKELSQGHPNFDIFSEIRSQPPRSQSTQRLSDILLSASDKERQPSPSQTSDLEELLAELRKLEDYRLDESISTGTPSSLHCSGLSDSEASSFSSPSFSATTKATEELSLKYTPTRFDHRHGSMRIISRHPSLPSNESTPFPILCEGISLEDEAWLASEDDYAQPLTPSLDESEETLSQTESSALSESEQDEFEEISLSASQYDSEEEIDEFGFLIPSEEHVVMLQDVHEELRPFFTWQESEKAHRTVTQAMLRYGVFPELLQKIESRKAAAELKKVIQIEEPATAVVSPISTALPVKMNFYINTLTAAQIRTILYGGEPVDFRSAHSPVKEIRGVDISHDTMLPQHILMYGAMAVTGVVKGTILSLANDVASTLTLGINYALRQKPNPRVPYWAFQFPELIIERNPMLLGIKAARRTYQKPPLQEELLGAKANPFSVLSKNNLARLRAEDAIKCAQSQSKPEAKQDTPSPIKAAKRTLASAFDGSASTSASKRIHTPMRDELMTAAKRVVREVTELSSPAKTPLSRSYQQAPAIELLSTPVITHPLMFSESDGVSPPPSSSQRNPSRFAQPKRANVGISALPFRPVSPNANPPKASLLARWLGSTLPTQKSYPTPKPIDIEMVELDSLADQENQGKSQGLSPTKTGKVPHDNYIQGRRCSPSKQPRGFGSPRISDFENLPRMITE